MTTYRAVSRWAVTAILLFTAGGLAGCSAPAGPLRAVSAGGQPVVNGGSVYIHPGNSADFTAFVVNPLNSPVMLISAAVIPVTGSRPTGQLVHVGIGTTNGLSGSSDGWPVPHLPTRKLPGARIRHGQSNIIFGITGQTIGKDYTVAGLDILYRCHGQDYHVMAWSAAYACIAKDVNSKVRVCPDILGQLQDEVEKMAGASP